VIFVDTSFWVALASEKDPDHERVREVWRAFQSRPWHQHLLTTNHVIFESVTLAGARIDHAAGRGIGTRLYGETLASIHWATPTDERDAFSYYQRHDDKRYSAVDCLSFVVMQKRGIELAWTLDEDFRHRFTAVPGPRPKR
jgi:predicted nucleic acid-binding protein